MFWSFDFGGTPKWGPFPTLDRLIIDSLFWQPTLGVPIYTHTRKAGIISLNFNL